MRIVIQNEIAEFCLVGFEYCDMEKTLRMKIHCFFILFFVILILILIIYLFLCDEAGQEELLNDL